MGSNQHAMSAHHPNGKIHDLLPWNLTSILQRHTSEAASDTLNRCPQKNKRIPDDTLRSADASSSKCPRHHKWELSLPQRVAVRRDPFAHHDVRTCIAQRDRPADRVIEEERLQRA